MLPCVLDLGATWAAPPAAAALSPALEGQIVDVQGRTLANATVSATYMTRADLVTTQVAVADQLGHFQLAPVHERALPFQIGDVATFTITTEQGLYYEVNAVIKRGPIELRVPTRIGSKVAKIDEAEVGELAGTVIDHSGAPLAGVIVNVGYAHTGHETETDAQGQFRLKGFDRDEKVEVIFSKPGYSPETFMQLPTGVPGWVVALGNETFWEGTVLGAEGNPVKGALVRANQGPKRGSGFRRSELWTETRTDEQGRYRLYLQPDAYEVEVKAAAGGVARLKREPISYGEHRKLDIQLEPGVNLQITCVDAQTGAPVSHVRLHHWQKKDLNARSGEDGSVILSNLLPGRFEFNVDAKGYARWWSAEALSPWNRKSIDKPDLHWQRNFDSLDFDLSPGMKPVTIVLERGVHIRGRIVDPDGKPVAGATAAPALTGTGNSLTGDTRFSVLTDESG
ncbi:MAG: carboxypeptidase-like regulatory domain-containing protein, partial [Singulisphaera sp.]